MSDLKLGEPIPTGIPGIEIEPSDIEKTAEATTLPLDHASVRVENSLADLGFFDQLLLFPMKLGLSVALASAAMIASPMTMAAGRPQ